jgi:hypothetical protein
MQKLIGSLLAIGVAGVAAIAATTAMLNAPHRIDPAAVSTTNVAPAQDPAAPAAVPGSGPTTPGTTPATTPGPSPDAAKSAAPANDTAKEEDGEDKDPYEGIAPEELPPDLQYNADSSVSFPTNI